MLKKIAKLIREDATVGFASAQAFELPLDGSNRGHLSVRDNLAVIRELRLQEAWRPRDGEPYSYYLAGQKKFFEQVTASASELRRALARNPRHGPSPFHRGWCLEQEKQIEEAARLAALPHTARLDPAVASGDSTLQRESLKKYEPIHAIYSSR